MRIHGAAAVRYKMMHSPIRVLHIVGAMYPGGMENFIMNLYRNIDRSQFQFDFIVHQKKKNDYTEEIESLGGRVFLLPRLTRKPFANLHGIWRLVRENHYPMVIRSPRSSLQQSGLAPCRSVIRTMRRIRRSGFTGWGRS